MNSALTPATRTTTDDFDGSTVVRQAPVSAASSLSEAWHTLGFDWNSRTPETVFFTAGVQGTANIFGLAFNVDGQIITATEVSALTDYGPVSTRRYSVSYGDFMKIARASIVKMKVSGAHGYTVSSFGTSTSALVNKKLPPFIQKIQR